jgi:dTDP-4-amino-4,6-dideoxyglucose
MVGQPSSRELPVRMSTGDLAFFGGNPLFETPRPLGQLAAPDLETFLVLAKEALDNGQLTGGPFVAELEERLADFHEVRHCVAVANAALGITMLMRVFAAGRMGEVIMPAFTYPGLPHFARFAGQQPRFCDVCTDTHGLDPAAVRAAINGDTTSILGVCNSNGPPEIEELERIGSETGVPVFFDSVDGLGMTYGGRQLGRFGRAEVFSLHATKLLNGFEGGYVTTEDEGLADLLRWQCDHASPDSQPEAAGAMHALGLNANLSELHAAMALLSIEQVPGVIARNRARYEQYEKVLTGLPGMRLLAARTSPAEKTNWRRVVAEISAQWPLTRDQTVVLLQAEGAEIAPYYSPPLHHSVHCPPGYDVQPLPVCERLATQYLQLPVGELVSRDDIRKLGHWLAFVAHHGEAISALMAKGEA